MNRTLFHYPNNELIKTIKSRKSVNSSYYKSDANIAWSNSKTANVIITDLSTNTTLSAPTGGFDSIYQNNIPYPIIESLNISNEGRIGQLSKATLQLKFFSTEQVNEFANFFYPGNELLITSEWSVKLNQQSDKISFNGIVYNFTIKPETNFTYNVTINLVSKGFEVLGISIFDVEEEEKIKSEDSEGSLVAMNGFLNEIVKEHEDLNAKKIFKQLVNGLVIYKDMKIDPTDNEGNVVSTTTKLYITLERLISEINKNIIGELGTVSDTKILFDSEVIIEDKNIVSLDLYKIILPWVGYITNYSTYKEDVYLKGADQTIKNILLSYEFISSIVELMLNENTKSDSTLFTYFLDNIFNEIRNQTAGIIDLKLVYKDLNWWVCNDTSISTDKSFDENSALVFEIPNDMNVLRDFDIELKIPNAQITSLYLAGRTAGRPQVFNSIAGLKSLNDKNDVSDIDLELEINQWKYDYYNQLSNSTNREENLNLIRNQGIKLLGKVRQNEKAPHNTLIFFPYTLSLTLDGINGFSFGDIIIVKGIPGIYVKKNITMVFIVTNVEHSISGGSWITSVQTSCKLAL